MRFVILEHQQNGRTSVHKIMHGDVARYGLWLALASYGVLQIARRCSKSHSLKECGVRLPEYPIAKLASCSLSAHKATRETSEEKGSPFVTVHTDLTFG